MSIAHGSREVVGGVAPGETTARAVGVACAVIAIGAACCVALAYALATDGLSAVAVVMLAAFLVTLPWNVLNLVNAAIGLALRVTARDPLADLLPHARGQAGAALRGHTAILVPIHNEDPARVFGHLRAMAASLERTGEAARFELVVLSDTTDPAIAAREEAQVRGWHEAAAPGPALRYRRRPERVDAKTGNVRAFLDARGDAFDYCLMLDADSLMTGPAVLRLVRLMEADPKLGILQTLIVGLPSRSPFARIFQFGMRHGMRTYSLGSAWWQGEGGPYWGHNALLRTRAYMDFCRLPTLPGRPPFGGRILSHDQVEAVLMRRAGYAVRLLPVEGGSFEENPPTLPDFLERDLRWCQGNMQYGAVLRWPGLPILSRMQIALAMLMYLQSPAWMLFIATALAQSVVAQAGLLGEAPLVTPARAQAGHLVGLGLFAVMMTMVFAPKLAGLAETLIRAPVRRAYGGTGRVLAGAAVELAFSFVMTPIVAVLHTKFMVGMLGGRTAIWQAQRRAARHVPFAEALRNLWVPVAAGLGLALVAWAWAPGALPWLAPVLVALVGAPIFAWATSLQAFGRWLEARQLCATPEELDPPIECLAAGFGLRQAPSAPEPRAVAGGRPRR